MIQKHTKISLCGRHLTVNLFKYSYQRLYSRTAAFKVTQHNVHLDVTVPNQLTLFDKCGTTESKSVLHLRTVAVLVVEPLNNVTNGT